MSARRLSAPLLLLALTLPLACGPADEVGPTVPVSGSVSSKGKPLAKGDVTFHPDKAKGNTSPHLPTGRIEADGSFKLTTRGRDGAPAGWYKVTVHANESTDAKNPYAIPKSAVPKAYTAPDTTKLAHEVKADGPKAELKAD